MSIMLSSESFLNLYKQNNKLSIRLISPDFRHLPAKIISNKRLKQLCPQELCQEPVIPKDS